jgi:predicted alpha/beta-fold hydrolase
LKKRILYISLALTAIISSLAFFGAHKIAPYAIIKPYRTHETTTPKQLSLSGKSVEILTKDSLKLADYFIESQQDSTKGIIILVHGIGGCKEHFLGLSASLAEKGIATFVFDGRAHGKSEGKYCTYGFQEKHDISAIVDYLQEENPKTPIGIWGNSLGGAIAIQALELDERIQFGMIESTFADLSDIVYDYQKRITKGIGVRFLTDYALKRAGEIANFNPNEVKPKLSAKNIEPTFPTLKIQIVYFPK